VGQLRTPIPAIVVCCAYLKPETHHWFFMSLVCLNVLLNDHVDRLIICTTYQFGARAFPTDFCEHRYSSIGCFDILLTLFVHCIRFLAVD